MLNYLFATPYTPRAPSDRSGDLLGWSRLRQKLQRCLFPPFTVLTPRRTSAEVLLLYLKLLKDNQIKFPDQERQKNLRHLEILFGIASVVTENVQDISDLIKAAENNPYNILNIERIRQYLANRQNTGEPLCYSRKEKDYFTNLSYGIGPHYSASLRRFGLVDEVDQLTKGGQKLVPCIKKYQIVENIVIKWFDKTRGVTLNDLKNLKKYVWDTIDKKHKERTNQWLNYVQNSTELKSTFFSKLCEYIIQILPVDSTEAFQYQIYRIAFENNIKLRNCLVECRTFEVVTALADFLLYSLILFSESSGNIDNSDNQSFQNIHVDTIKKLSVFIKHNQIWLSPVISRLFTALEQARRLGNMELCNFPGLPNKGDTSNTAIITNVLKAILERHKRQKGSTMTFVDFDDHEETGDIVLKRTDRQQDDLNAATELQKILVRQHKTAPLPELINENTPPQDFQVLLQNDKVWKDFIAGNFLWHTFGTWFGCIVDSEKNFVEEGDLK